MRNKETGMPKPESFLKRAKLEKKKNMSVSSKFFTGTEPGEIGTSHREFEATIDELPKVASTEKHR